MTKRIMHKKSMGVDKKFSERRELYDGGENQFKDFCSENEIEVYRFGFDQKDNPITGFQYLKKPLRSLPDYIKPHKHRTIFIEAKGTSKWFTDQFTCYKNFMSNHSLVRVGVDKMFIFVAIGSKTWICTLNKAMKLIRATEKKRTKDKQMYADVRLSDLEMITESRFLRYLRGEI